MSSLILSNANDEAISVLENITKTMDSHVGGSPDDDIIVNPVDKQVVYNAVQNSIGSINKVCATGDCIS